MNATLINGGKVHRWRDGFARCGVGRNAKTRTWQMELGDVTCQRCVKLNEADGRKESSGGTPEPTRGTRVLQHA
jgi:hypothetical protein